MSNVPDKPVEPPQSELSPPAASRPPAKTSPLRLTILLVILGLGVAAVGYDRAIARPKANTAYETVYKLQNGDLEGLDEVATEALDDGAVSQAEVRQVLGRDPTQTEEIENGLIEIYSYQSGLPFIRTYDVYVVYSGKQNRWLHDCAQGERPDDSRLPRAVAAENTAEVDPDNFEPPEISGAGAGAGAELPPGAGTPLPPELRGDGQGDDATEDDATEDDATEDDATEDDATEDDATEDDATEDDATEDDATEDDATEDDATEDDATEDDATEDDATEDDATEDDATEDDATEDDATEDDATEDDGSDDGASDDDSSGV